MRWFQSPLLRLVEPVPLVSFSPCVNILKMTILPLRLISPLQERTFSGNSFRELLAVLLGDFIYPRQATPSICMIVMQWHGLNYLNLFKICISYVWFVHGISRSIVWSCYCHDIVWSTRANILQLMWLTCCLWILSGYYGYFHDGIMRWSITLDIALPLDY